MSGSTIDEISQSAIHAIKQRPNVVLLLAGTNDIERNLNVGDAPTRLNGLIGTVRAICPDAVVLVGKIPKNKSHEPVSSARIVAYNNGIERIVAGRIALGQHIVLVDMFNALVRADLFDNIHPNDIGYRKMANSWAHGLERAAAKGWIRNPVGSIQVAINRKKCDHVPNWGPYYPRIATGAGLGTSFFPAEICRASR